MDQASDRRFRRGDRRSDPAERTTWRILASAAAVATVALPVGTAGLERRRHRTVGRGHLRWHPGFPGDASPAAPTRR